MSSRFRYAFENHSLSGTVTKSLSDFKFLSKGYGDTRCSNISNPVTHGANALNLENIELQRKKRIKEKIINGLKFSAKN